MESYSVDYDYYYNNKDRPQEASSNRKNFHAITFPNIIVFITQKNNAYPVCIKRQTQRSFCLYKKSQLLLPLTSRIFKQLGDVKGEFGDLGENFISLYPRLEDPATI